MKTKCLVYFFLSIILICTLSAESDAKASGTENITLPDVTTVISGNTLVTGSDAVPDFSDVLPDENTAVAPLPRLPDLHIPDESEDSSGVSGPNSGEKDIYAEGLVGGGYPGFFTGNFSVYRSKGDNPFLLRFAHESVNGYSRESVSDGFFDSTTAVHAEKKLLLGNTGWNFTGSYNKTADGLQNVSPAFYDMTKQTLEGTVSLTVPYDAVTLFFTAGADWYNRYAGWTGDAVVTETEKGVSFADFDPLARIRWQRDNLELGLSGSYRLETNVGNDSAISGYDGDLTAQQTNRGKFGADIRWSSSGYAFYANASAVVGSALGDNSVIMPFAIGASVEFETPLSARAASVSAEGGLLSLQEKYSQLEQMYKFTCLSFIPGETTDWYGTVKAAVPLDEHFTVSGSVDYKKTAFGNGVWEPEYTDAGSSGLYGYSQTDRTLMKTTAMVSASFGGINTAVDLVSYWKHVPALESGQSAGLKVSVQSPDAKIGADGGIRFEFGTDADYIPEFNTSVYCRLTPSLRLAARADDIVKLASGKTRTYAGSYIARSGTATVLVKFFF